MTPRKAREMIVTVHIPGELSVYTVSRETGRVHQVKTNRRTGRQFATDITATSKAQAIIKRAIAEWDAGGRRDHG